MKKIKSIISILLALSLVFCSVVFPASAADGAMIEITSAEGKPGETVEIFISNKNVPVNHTMWQLNFTYPTVLGEGTVTELHNVTWEDKNIACENGYFSLLYYTTDSTQGDINGQVAKVAFTIPADATVGTVYDLTPAVIGEEVLICDAEYNLLDITCPAATITVVGEDTSDDGAMIEISSAEGAPGETVEIFISNKNVPVNHTMWQLNFTYPTVLGEGTVTELHNVTWEDKNIACENGYFSLLYYTTDSTQGDINGQVAKVAFTIPADATAGTVYDLTPAVIGEEVLICDAEYNLLDITCPAATITVTGTVAPTTYGVTVNNGTADVTEAPEGATVTITANAAATGMVFKNWTVVSGGVTLASTTSATTTFTMGTAAVEVTANYEAMAVDVYVTDGSYTGTAAYGETITITADTAATGYEFDKWVVTSGSVTLADETAATTTFTMGTEGVAVQATYKKINYTVSICPDITGGTITAVPTTATYGDTVTVTLTPDSGKKLSKLYYTIDGDTTEYAINATLKTFTMPAANVEVHAEFADITGIIITGDYRGEAGDLIYTGDTNVEVTLTVSNNSDAFAGITFTLDIEDGLTTATPVFTPASGLEILAQNGNTYTVWSAYADDDLLNDTFLLGTVTIPTVTALSSANDAQYKVSLTVDDYMISNGTADAVNVDIVDGTVFVSKTVEAIKFYDASNGYAEFTTIEVDETVEDKDGYVADYINANVVYELVYTDGTTSDTYKEATADMFADLTTDVTDDMVGGQQATITGSYTQEDTNTTVIADVVVTIALNETIVGITVTPDTLYFKVGDTFAWGDTQYTLTQANDGTVGPNAVAAGVQAGTLTDDSAALDNTVTTAQTVTVTYAADTTVTDTVTVYFVAPEIIGYASSGVYYEEGATFDINAQDIEIEVSYNEEVTGIADDVITTGFTVVTPPSLTLADGAIAATQDLVISYNGSADYTIEAAAIVVDFAEFGKVLVGSLTADDTVTTLLKLSNYGTDLVTTDLIAVRNIAIRA
ncbi:MAG: hypothetical protein IJZ94_00095 [Clostridia bacterium]|nr:hypothetical protein [Clostridia bacterium]